MLGSVYGVYCGYFPDRLTQVGKNAHLTDSAQCRVLFEPAAAACVAEAKAAGQWHVSNSAEGRALGERIGSCIDAAYTAALGPPAMEPATEFESWVSQVVGSVYGLYCGYYPDRTTITGAKMGSHSRCTERFAAAVPVCVTPEVEAQFVPGDSEQGKTLGESIGTCFDLNLGLATILEP